MAKLLGASPAPRAVQVMWLGQAGFLIRAGSISLVIDAYLSDSLAEKYRGAEFAHERMMPVPVDPRRLGGLAAVLATHGHTDHLDPGTLPFLADASPDARFVVPRAHRDLAVSRGVPAGRVAAVNPGDVLELDGTRVTAVASAHESRAQDANGNELFLGYVIEIGATRFYHSGDSVPYDGLEIQLRALEVDVAMLPINGRDEYRRSRGVPGNFTVEEAFALARGSGCSHLVAHHFGMFSFNTIAREDALRRFRGLERDFGSPQVVLPEVGVSYSFTRS